MTEPEIQVELEQTTEQIIEENVSGTSTNDTVKLEYEFKPSDETDNS